MRAASRLQRIAEPTRQRAEIVNISEGAALVWRGPEYPVLPGGKYTVRGVQVQGPQWLPNYQRWSLRVEFTLIDDPVLVSAFFNFGMDRNRPHIGRRSRYYKAWVLANGEHPRKRQDMSPNVFLEGKFFEVEVQPCNRDEHGQPKPDAEIYSTVTKIISARWP
jgi:hypothetical protein